jgi:hypothetical protein
MDDQLKTRWHAAVSNLRRGQTLYIRQLASACAKGDIDLNTYARLKLERQDQTRFLLYNAMALKGLYAVIFLECLSEHLRKLDNQYGIVPVSS